MELVLLIIYIFSLSVLFLFATHYLFIIFFYFKTKNKFDLDSNLIELEYEKCPIVTVQLPIYNEKYVVERVLNSVINFDYPKDKLEIQVLDDSTDETKIIVSKLVEKYKKEGFDIKHIKRSDRIGFKAGALKNGLDLAKGEFIAIFDADFKPDTSFLKTTLPYFSNKKIGMVQTRWEHINRNESWITKAQAIALDAHFTLEQLVRNRAGFFMTFNGTAGIWRKECIVDAGNWQFDTLTEDFDLSYRAQLKGWNFHYLNEYVSPAELPSNINALKIQQFRWGKGAIETCIKHLPSILKSDFKLLIKLESIFHLTSYLVFPFMLIVALLNIPILIIKLDSNFSNLFNYFSIFLIASFATTMFYGLSQKILHKDWKEKMLDFPYFLISSMGLAVNNTKAVFEALFGNKSDFIRTPKQGNQPKNKNDYFFKKSNGQSNFMKNAIMNYMLHLELLLFLYFVLALIFSIRHQLFIDLFFQLMLLASYGLIWLYSIKPNFKLWKSN